MTTTEFLLYLIYGYAMITMGIFALKQKDVKMIDLYLVKSLKYLGYFGIFHGASEWISMIIKLELYPESNLYLTNINQIIKAISFAFLLYFGLDLLPLRERTKRKALKAPIILFLIYASGFIMLIANYGLEYHLLDTKFNTVVMRYSLMFPSCMISAVALFINAWLIEKTRSSEISKRYMNLAWVFIIYGILEGLIVSKANFFPANIVNKELFIEYFKFSPLFIKAFIGFVINFLLIKVMETFNWEQEEKLNKLEKLRIASEERRKLALEIHDSIIQGLYAVGLKVEYLSLNKDGDKTRDILGEIKSGLNNTISKTREFISSTSLDKIECEDLKCNIEELIAQLSGTQNIRINLNCKVSPYMIGHLSPEKSTQIYYIIQEALSNVIKHSGANQVDILMEGRYDLLYITIEDNGKGFSTDAVNPLKQFGIASMKDRTERIGGVFIIKKVKTGTLIELKIPWDEMDKPS